MEAGELRRSGMSEAKPSSITLEVSGMTCGSCVRHVTSALTRVDGVAQVEVALRQGLVHVAPTAERAPSPSLIAEMTAEMIAALDRAGYPARAKAS